MKPVANWIKAVKIWIVLFPSLTLLLFLTGEVLAELPLLLRTFLLTIFLVPWVLFIGVPLLEQLMHFYEAKRIRHDTKQKV